MDIKVRDINSPEQKSRQQVEDELIKMKEEQDKNALSDKDKKQDQQHNDSDPVELKDEDVLSFFQKKYNKKVSSIDELFIAPKEPEKLPSDVETFYKYKKDTGRGIDDFVKLNKDFDKLNPDALLREYYSATEEGLDPEDIESMIQELTLDEEIADEADIKKAKLAKKKLITQAKKFFNEQKEKYKAPLESRSDAIPDVEIEDFKAYKQFIEKAKTDQEKDAVKRDWFVKKTDELLNSDFKGFEFAINDKKITYAPADAAEIKKTQMSPLNFINKFLDENGVMKDAAGYHRALSMAMNPDKVAKFFYDQGVAEATESIMKNQKNIRMTDRRVPEVTRTGETQVRSVSSDTGHGLKIKINSKT